ncbi:MAG TPA: hypothetical protein VI752_01640 [Candidatus Paceibacterota bacterium]
MNQYQEETNRNLIHNILNEVKDEFTEAGEIFENEDIEAIDGDLPTQKHFPGMIFSLAVLKDIVDSVSLTGIGLVLTTITSISIAVILFCWILLNGGGAWKKRAMKNIWARFVAYAVLETIPYINLIPFNTILVWTIHNKEKKLVILFNSALEKFKNAGF